MNPRAARAVMTIAVLAVAAVGVWIVNARFEGAFLPGLLLIVVPVLALSHVLPKLLPVRCPGCGGRMRFHFLPAQATKPSQASDLYGYRCERCTTEHLWEGTSSGSFMD